MFLGRSHKPALYTLHKEIEMCSPSAKMGSTPIYGGKPLDTIEELLEALRNPGEDGVPGDLPDRIHAAYTSMQESADAKVQELTGVVATKDQAIADLKSHNYDLMRSIPATEPEVQEESEDEDSPDYDDLFED